MVLKCTSDLIKSVQQNNLRETKVFFFHGETHNTALKSIVKT